MTTPEELAARREAILAHLAECEAAGHPPLTESDVAEFRQLVDEPAQ